MGARIEVKGIQGTIRFDGHTITVLRKRPFHRRADREDLIPLSRVTTLDVEPAGALTNDFVRLTVGRDLDRPPAAGAPGAERECDRFSLLFRRSRHGEVTALRDAVHAARAAAADGCTGRGRQSPADRSQF